MLGIKPDQLRPLPQLKVREIKPRSNSTASQCERLGIANLGSKPASRLDDCLQDLTRVGIAAQMNFRVAAVRLDYMHGDRAAGIEMPELIRPQAMESGKVFSVQQEIDCRGPVNCGGKASLAMESPAR